jgi:hypothetical protein
MRLTGTAQHLQLDRYVSIARMARIAGGDNRLIPMHVDTAEAVRYR